MERSLDLNIEEYQETSTVGNKVYSTSDLWLRAKDAKILKVPIAAIDFASRPWGPIDNIYQFSMHYARCFDADMSMPILLAPDGGIVDGYHRLCRAVVEGNEYIDAKQLKAYPEPITINKD